MRATTRGAAVAILTMALGACGLKGPLSMPVPPVPPASARPADLPPPGRVTRNAPESAHTAPAPPPATVPPAPNVR